MRAVLLLLLCAIACPAYAGGGIRFVLPAVKNTASKLPQEIELQRLISQQMSRAALYSQTAKWAQQNRADYFSSSSTLPFQRMATIASLPEQTDPLFALRNEQMALPWFETIEKDLAFLREQQPAIEQTLEISHVLPDELEYADLIPPQARKIYVGEEHNQPAIYKAFEKMVFQYQSRYPDRKIIILTEFVSDRLHPWQMPGQSIGRWEMPLRRNNRNFAFFNKFMKAGIEVIGLENVAYIKEHEALITPEESQSQSVYGMQERNAHWRQIISYVSSQHPQAVLFIYAGSMHTHYRAPFTLANPSAQNFVFQLEADYLGADMPFGFVMADSPLTRTDGLHATVLHWMEKDPVFRTRSGFDACVILPRLVEENKWKN